MNSRKKIINDLRFQLDSKEVKNQHYPVQLFASDAEKILAMLKEQEPIKPNKIGAGWFCGGCNKFLISNDEKRIKFCWSCGKPVLWEDR